MLETVSQKCVTIEQFMQEEKLKVIGEGFHVRVLSNTEFPQHVVKEYNCSQSNLNYLFDNETKVIRRIAEQLQNEPPTRVVLPEIYESKIEGKLLFEMFQRIYPPSAASIEDDGEMVGICFSNRDYYYQRGRGHIYGPEHLEKYFHEEVPSILHELGKAFALLHFKAFVTCTDVEIVIGKSSPTDPLKLFIIDFDRAEVLEILSRDELLKKLTGILPISMYCKRFYRFNHSDVFKDFSKVAEEFKQPFISGYLQAAGELGYQSEAEAIAKGI